MQDGKLIRQRSENRYYWEGVVWSKIHNEQCPKSDPNRYSVTFVSQPSVDLTTMKGVREEMREDTKVV